MKKPAFDISWKIGSIACADQSIIHMQRLKNVILNALNLSRNMKFPALAAKECLIKVRGGAYL